MLHVLVTLVKALLISMVFIALADYFDLPFFSEAGGGVVRTLPSALIPHPFEVH